MRAGGGKHKGSSYERGIGAKLSLWLSEGQRKDLICRTVGSGAQFTWSKSGNPGDLMAQHPLAFKFFDNFVVECKHWRDLELLKFFSRKGDLYKALKKVEKEAVSSNKKWWLICRQNRYPDLLILAGEPTLDSVEYCPQYHILFFGVAHIYYLDEFLKLVNPNRYIS